MTEKVLIAEFCQNHNGDFNILEDMIYQAKEAGATHGKIQSIYAKNLTKRERFEKGLIDNNIVKIIKRPYSLEFERLKKLELSKKYQVKFIVLCKKVGLIPLTTIFSRDLLEEILSLGFKEIKIASYDCASFPLINDLKSAFNRLFISTGSTFDYEIEKTAKILNNTNYSFLHCVTKYPTFLKDYNLNRINYLKKFTKNVGWSDHGNVEKDGVKGTLAAIYYGAKIIERHFTILPRTETKDGPVSINYVELKKIADFFKLSKRKQREELENIFPDHQICIGDYNRELSEEELLNRDYYRGRFASIVNDKPKFNWED